MFSAFYLFNNNFSTSDVIQISFHFLLLKFYSAIISYFSLEPFEGTRGNEAQEQGWCRKSDCE